MEFRKADELLFSIFQECHECLTSKLSITKFPKTYSAMWSLMAKAGTLKLGLFNLFDEENIYSFKVVFRSFCEHYVKFFYVFVRFAHEKTDDIGDDYFSFCGAQEMVDYSKSLNVVRSILGYEQFQNYFEFVQEKLPNLDNSNKKELERKSGNFRYRSIIRYIAEKAPDIVKEKNQFLLKIIPMYATLSSYVHGGPGIDEMPKQNTFDISLEKIENEASLAFLMHSSMLLFTTMAMSREYKSLQKVSYQVNHLINEYLISSDNETD